jgi:hypothetical protein
MSLTTIDGILAQAEVVEGVGVAYAVVITPDLAEELLKTNDNIRNVKKGVVGRYAADMMLGRWRVTGETIIFDKKGRLKNGQHRLRSCILSGVPFTTWVVVGVDPDVILDIDAGAKRTLADFLAFNTYGDSKNLGAAIRLAYELDVSKKITQEGFSPETLWHWFSPGHESLVEDLATVRRFEKTAPQGLTRAHMAAIRHAAPDMMTDTVMDFFHLLAWPQATDMSNSPASLLRTFMTRFSAQHKTARLQPMERIAVTIKALNLYAAGHETTTRDKIVWRRGQEDYPQITPSIMDEFVADVPGS